MLTRHRENSTEYLAFDKWLCRWYYTHVEDKKFPIFYFQKRLGIKKVLCNFLVNILDNYWNIMELANPKENIPVPLARLPIQLYCNLSRAETRGYFVAPNLNYLSNSSASKANTFLIIWQYLWNDLQENFYTEIKLLKNNRLKSCW